MIHDPSRPIRNTQFRNEQDPGHTIDAFEQCKIDSCGFCQLTRGGDDEFTARNGVRPDLEIRSGSGSVMAIMDSFPIGHGGGHVLIVPRRHMISLSQFDDQAALSAMVDEVAAVMESTFPEHWLLSFEHGPGDLAGQRVKCGGCHVDHAHGHILVLPAACEFEEIREETESVLSGLGWDLSVQGISCEKPFLDLADVTFGQPYLQIGRLGAAPLARTYVQSEGQATVPSQLLRRVVSTVLGKASPIHWNWKIAVQQNLVARLQDYRDDALDFQKRFNAASRTLRETRVSSRARLTFPLTTVC